MWIGRAGQDGVDDRAEAGAAGQGSAISSAASFAQRATRAHMRAVSRLRSPGSEPPCARDMFVLMDQSAPRMKDFWLSCGHHLLDRDAGGGLVATDEFLKAYLARPELAPPPEACVVERTLHAALLANPRRPVAAADIAAIADPDARENWELMIAFRDRLLAHPTLEAAYLSLMRDGPGRTPLLFMNQLVHVILRNVLDGCDDACLLRAAELFFRPQRITLHDGAALAADEERIASVHPSPASPLVSLLGLERSVAIDVLSDDNAADYFARSDAYDMALDLTAGRRGLVALAQVIARWIRHMLAVDVAVEPIAALRDARLTWYVGLDAEGTRIGDRLWRGEPLDAAANAQLVGLFCLTFRDRALMTDAVAGEPVYLILAMTPQMSLRMKPQNLLAGLPVRQREPAA
jgi:hypothetical protein